MFEGCHRDKKTTMIMFSYTYMVYMCKNSNISGLKTCVHNELGF